jgi:purine-nucleoside phosphorylase
MKSLKDHLGKMPLRYAIVLGTGLSMAAQARDDDRLIAYSEIEGFPHLQVSGHAGHVLLRKSGAFYDAFLLGRAHAYERGDAAAMKGAIAALAQAGAQSLLLTCATGSTRAHLTPGMIVHIEDHINFSGLNPLIGETGDRRFVPMVKAYDSNLSDRLKQAAQQAKIEMQSGIYMWFSGPSFETPAEIRMAQNLGADLVGMSIVPEVILARFFGLPVAALAIVTNFAAGLAGGNPTHEESKRVAAQAADHVSRILSNFLAQAS